MKKGPIIAIIVVVLLIALAVTLVMLPEKPGRLDQFATCVKDSGALFYGAFWCPHCRDQKAMFGRSVDLLPYVECSAADGQSQLQTCTDKGIQSYPTWDFPNGERRTGVVSLADLAAITQCQLP
jgi:hypothetical protein